MGLKFFSKYMTVDGIVKEIRLFKEDYEGEPIEWICGDQGVVYDVGDSDSFFGNPILPSQAKLSFIFQENYDLREFVYDRKTFFVQVVIPSPEKIEWSGWLEPWDAAHEYMEPGYEVSLTASCGLAHLSKKKYKNVVTTTHKTGLKIIQECLIIIGSELPMRISTHMKENSYAGTAEHGLESFEIDTNRYYDENGDSLYCDVIVSDILQKFNAEILQWDNRWVVRAIVDNAIGTQSYFDLAYGENPIPSARPWPGAYVINSTFAYSLDDGQLRILPPINKYRTEVNLNPQKVFFENGNMILWTEAGLSGWDFSHMPKGNPGWEQFVLNEETGQSILKINGRSSGPYTKKKKKKLGQVLIPILTGAVGANLKNKSVDVEPSEWIESSAGIISAGDKSLKISFEYYTAPDSSNAMISIRLINSWHPGKDLWVAPGTANSGCSDIFKWIILPPVEEKDLGNGKKAARGLFETTVLLDKINLYSPQFAADAPPFKQVVVRFYKITNSPSTTGDWWKIFNLKGALEGFVATEQSGNYATTLEVGGKTDEEAETITLLTGDYNPWFTGSLLKPGTSTNTQFWSRRPDIDEDISIYRAMMLDRLSMTRQPLRVFEGDIKLMRTQPTLTYLHRLQFEDQGNTQFRIVRFSYEEKRRIAKITAIEIRFSEPPADLIRQDSYIPGRGALNPIPGTGDGIYPTKEDSTGGRISAEETSLTPEELEEQITTNGRLGALFENIDPLTFVVSVESTEAIDLVDYLSVLFIEGNENLEPEDQFDPETFILAVVDKPVWVSKVEIELLEVTATALAPKTGQYYITMTATEPESGLVIEFRLPILVVPSEDFIEAWPPKFVNLPALVFIQKQTATRHLVLSDYLDPDGEHTGVGLVYEILDRPDWVTEQTVVFNDLAVTGTPPIVETQTLLLQISDAIGRLSFLRVILKVIPAPTVKYSLLETGYPDPVVLGSLPGAFLLPVKWDQKTVVSGLHNKVYRKISKGSNPDENVLVEDTEAVNSTTSGEYLAFEIEGGITTEVGLYRLEHATFIDDLETSRDIIFFTLYDEEYEGMLRFELWNAGKIGDIAMDSSSKFKKPDFFNPKVILTDLEHDKAILTLSLDGVVLLSVEFTDVDDEYSVYETVPANQLSGTYTLNAQFELDGNMVYERQTDFEILVKTPEPEAGLTYGTMIPGTANFEPVQELPLKGVEIDLPVKGYNVLATSFGGALDWVGIEVFFGTGSQVTEIDVPKYTKKPNYVVYSQPVTEVEIYAFDILSSLDISDIHQAPSKVRFRFTARLGGESGEIVGIKQADISFRVPLTEADYSGLRFLHVGPDVNNLIDPNMPKSGRTYQIPEYPLLWTAAFRKLASGLEFDEVKVQLTKNGVNLHLYGADCITDVSFPATTELTTDQIAYIFGNLDGEIREVLNPSNVLVSIDEPGLYKATFTVYRYATAVGILSSEFTLALEDEIEEVEEEDCCGGCKSLTFNFAASTTWNVNHNLGRRPSVAVIIGGAVWNSTVTHNDLNNLTITHKRPRAGSAEIE